MSEAASEKKKTVLIVGGGAAGMTAAIWAARRGASVTLLESMNQPGQKLLLTGNGRCNLTNTDPELAGKYYGSGSALAASVIRQFDSGQVISFFNKLGLLTWGKNGYVYPYTARSGSVLAVLLAELRRLGIKLKYSEKVRAVSFRNGKWEAKTDTWQYSGDALILACGSRAVPATGSDGSGYDLALSLGHRIIPPVPALVPVVCAGDAFRSAAGVRCRARVSLVEEKNGEEKLIRQETGELQWTGYGVSGIVVFQLSRFISDAQSPGSLMLKIDLLPDFDISSLLNLLRERAAWLPDETAAVLLAGFLPERLTPLVLKQAGVSPKTRCGDISEQQLVQILDTATALTLAVTGTKSFDACQVCGGGVDCREISPDTLESKIQRGLYFAGEILDVDGPCGGYNLQWAWSSGYVAGCRAAEDTP